MHDAHGALLSRQRLPLAVGGPPLVIGRDIACDVIVDDPYVAGRHAELTLQEDGTLRITDLSDVNGIIIRGERLRGARLVPLQDGRVRLGHSNLRIRSAIDPLPAEQPDRESLRAKHREYGVALIGALLCLGFAFFSAWVVAPDETTVHAARYVLIGAGVLGSLLAFWVLAGRFRRARARVSTHAAILALAAAACLWLNWGTDLAVFVTGLAVLQPLGIALQLAVLASALYLHLRAVNWLPRQQALVVACALPALVFAGYTWYLQEQREQDVNHVPRFARLFPPSWSNQSGVPVDIFIDESVGLHEAVDEKRADTLEE